MKIKNKNKKELVWGWLFLVLAILPILAVISINSSAQEKEVNKYGCFEHQVAPSHFMVLVDATDPLTEKQKLAMRNYLKQQLQMLPKASRLDLYVLKNTDQRLMEPIVSECVAPSEKDVDKLTGNKRLINRAFEKKFDEILDKTNAIASRSQYQETHLIEAIVELSLRFDKYVADRQLVIISDMMERSSVADHYENLVAINSNSLGWNDLIKGSLKKIDLTVLYLLREKNGTVIQSRSHEAWWTNFFNDQSIRAKWVRPEIEMDYLMAQPSELQKINKL